jgi:hypothetical protein
LIWLDALSTAKFANKQGTVWGGWLYYVHQDGTMNLLLDTHTTKKRTADIGHGPNTRIIYAPTFLGKSVDV